LIFLYIFRRILNNRKVENKKQWDQVGTILDADLLIATDNTTLAVIRSITVLGISKSRTPARYPTEDLTDAGDQTMPHNGLVVIILFNFVRLLHGGS